MNGKGVILRQEILGSKIKTKSDARNGAFGIVPKELDGAIVSQDFPLFKVNTDVILS